MTPRGDDIQRRRSDRRHPVAVSGLVLAGLAAVAGLAAAVPGAAATAAAPAAHKPCVVRSLPWPMLNSWLFTGPASSHRLFCIELGTDVRDFWWLRVPAAAPNSPAAKSPAATGLAAKSPAATGLAAKA